MTTQNDDVLDRQKRFGDRIYDEGVYPSGYQDPAGVYPRSHYYYQSSINEASRGLIRNDLATNGGIPTLQRRNILDANIYYYLKKKKNLKIIGPEIIQLLETYKDWDNLLNKLNFLKI